MIARVPLRSGAKSLLTSNLTSARPFWETSICLTVPTATPPTRTSPPLTSWPALTNSAVTV